MGFYLEDVSVGRATDERLYSFLFIRLEWNTFERDWAQQISCIEFNHACIVYVIQVSSHVVIPQ